MRQAPGSEVIQAKSEAVVPGQEYEFPELHSIALPSGYVVNLGIGPVVIDQTGRTIIQPYSTRYAGLVHYVDVDLSQIISEARYLRGPAVALVAEEEFGGYGFWLLNFLPRLLALPSYDKAAVIIGDDTSSFHWDTLALLGIKRKSIHRLRKSRAVKADMIVAFSDNSRTPGELVRIRLGAIQSLRRHFLPVVRSERRDRRSEPPSKLFVASPRDAKFALVNEDALMSELSQLGFVRIDLGRLTVKQQIAAFAQASHVIGLHGDGLANIAFASVGTRVLEIFPAKEGSQINYFVAAQQGLLYGTYVGTDVAREHAEGPTLVHVDPAVFVQRATLFLN